MKKLNLKDKKCLYCGQKIEIKTKRDLIRKKFCCRSCSAKYYSEKGIFKFDWGNKEAAEKAKEKMRKPHKITKTLLKAAQKRGLKRKGTKTKSDLIVCKYCGKDFFIAHCRNNGSVSKWGQKQIRQYCSNKCRCLASRKVESLKVDKVRLEEWGLKVFKRDDYVCQKCGCKRKRLLQAHHKKSKAQYPELAYDVDNGETLCVYCHIKEHPKLKNFILSSLKLKLGVPHVTNSV